MYKNFFSKLIRGMKLKLGKYTLEIESNLHKRATFLKAKNVFYTQVAVLSRVGQKICHEESLLSVRVRTRFTSKEHLAVCFTSFYPSLHKITCIYNASWVFHGFFCSS